MSSILEKATRQHTRDHNSQLILSMIYEHGEVSRAELARMTRLTRTTVSDVVSGLIEQLLVEEVGPGISSGGRQPILLRIVENSRYLIGINLIDNQLLGAIINLRGVVQQRAIRALDTHEPDTVLSQIYDLIDELLAEISVPILGIGISTPGLMDVSAEVVRRAVNLGWQDLQLKALIHERYQLPVYMGNLAHMAALAEQTFGVGQQRKNLIVIHISQGIGAGIILNGELFHGDAYGAGEIGHAVVVEGGEACNCGNYGCLETVADSRAIIRRAHQVALAKQPSLSPGEMTAIDFNSIVQSVRRGDPQLRQIVVEAGHYLGMVVAHLVSILNVELIVITGPVAQFGTVLREGVVAAMQKYALPTLALATEVVVLEDNPDTTLLGISALLLKNELGLTRFVSQQLPA